MAELPCPGDGKQPFCAEHTEYWTARGIAPDYAAARGCRCVDAAAASAALGHTAAGPGVLIPFPGSNYARVRFCAAAALLIDAKEHAPSGAEVELYVPQDLPASGPLCVVESATKALALMNGGIAAVGLSGTGTCLADGELNSSWAAVDVVQRRMVVLMDAGRSINPTVARDERRQVVALERAGATVQVAALPLKDGRTDQGPDDFAAMHGFAALQAVIDAAVPACPLARATSMVTTSAGPIAASLADLLVDLPFLIAVHMSDLALRTKIKQLFKKHALGRDLDKGVAEAARRLKEAQSTSSGEREEPYFVDGGEIYIRRLRGAERLTNFTLEAIEERVHVDGEKSTTTWVVAGTLHDGTPLPERVVTREDLARETWWIGKWDGRATVYVVQQRLQHLHTAMLVLSPNMRRTRIVTHTGFSKVDGAYLFAHAGGTIGGNVQVDIRGTGARYVLPDTTEGLSGALDVAAALMEVGPRATMGPLFVLPFRALLSEFLLFKSFPHLVGATGVGKTTLVQLTLRWHGVTPGRLFPWDTTAAAASHHVHVVKDMLCEIDDFAPTSASDLDEMRKLFSKVVHSVSEGVGRARMSRELQPLEVHAPRGIPLSTGEDASGIRSILARLWQIEVRGLDMAAMSRAQDRGSELAIVTRSFVEWLLPQVEVLTERLPRRRDAVRDELRATVFKSGGHARAPERAADLLIAVELLERFINEVAPAATAFIAALAQARAGIIECSAGQAAGEVVDELHQVVEVLRHLIESNEVVLSPREVFVGVAEEPRLIGFYSADEIYLYEAETYSALTEAFRKQGESLSWKARTLFKRLHEAGYTLSGDEPGRLTRRQKIGGGDRMRAIVVKRPRFPVTIPLSDIHRALRDVSV